ncbi:Gem-associated protein 5 like protein [Argiope bruennichi]|uniref:Gem-associated protein 5 like protein n=1 Tax=Argiope bruennichi TaxID=94029 RepID=A0A8T0F0I0_ARGBR|nr:Gem-associated protein 5 like protein [Argiope bruennichi]
MPGTTRYSATFDRPYEEEERPASEPSNGSRRSRSQSWQANIGGGVRSYSSLGHNKTPPQRSSSTDSGTSSGTEHIPTRTVSKTVVKTHNNPFQFVKVGSCPLYKKAEEQLKKVKEVKKPDVLKEEEEEWQSNLDSWKSRRRKMSEDVFRRQEEIRQFEQEEQNCQVNQKKIKTFSEMVESRANRGRTLSLCLISSPLELQEWEDQTNKSNSSHPFSEGSAENSAVNSEDEGVAEKRTFQKNLWSNGNNGSSLKNDSSNGCKSKMNETSYADSGLESISSSHRMGDTPDSCSDFSQDSGSSIDCDSPRVSGLLLNGVNILEDFNSKCISKSDCEDSNSNSKTDPDTIFEKERSLESVPVLNEKTECSAKEIQPVTESDFNSNCVDVSTATKPSESSADSSAPKSLSNDESENNKIERSIESENEVFVDDFEELDTQSKVFCSNGIYNIEWIYGSPNTLVFPQDLKYLLKWNIVTNNVTKIRLGSDLKVCFISSNEKCPNLLAVGHNNGTITVLDIVQEKILQKFKDHIREISILTWNPVLPDNLLSVSLDYSVRSWRIGEDKSTKLFWLGRVKPEDKRRIRVLGIWHPQEADVIICSNSYGEVGEVRLSDEKPQFKPYSKMAAEVSCKFLIALFSGTLKVAECTADILYCFDNYMFSIWNITEKKLVSFLPFSMGFIFDLSFSPTNPIYMSISNGDGMMRIWNTQADSQISRIISVFVQAKAKIMTAAWHPTLENIIAFATDDGKLGIIDIIKKRSQYSFETIHKSRVYSVCWGPYKASLIEEILRYMVLKVTRLLSKKDCILYTYSQISIEAISNSSKQSHPLVFSTFIVLLTLCNLEIKFVESLKWHPENTYMSPTGSPLKFWLACGGNDNCIYILDTSKIFEEKNEDFTNWVVKKLTGHKKRINAICWSPHKDGYLVSVSKDGSALVWNACTGNIIVSFLSHFDVVNTVQWSMFDEDIIYSGGQDCFVRVWRISEQSSVAPADKVRTRTALRKPNMSLRAIEKSQDSEEVADKFAEIIATENTDQNVIPDVNEKETNAGRFSWQSKQDQAFWLSPKARKSVSLFGNTSTTKEEDLKDCMRLADILCKRTQECDESFDPFKPKDETLSNADAMKFGLYTDQNTALKMADVQADECKSKNQINRFCQISVMTNKMEFIKEAAVNGTLSSYLVSLAPSVSYTFWLEMCEKYAMQLIQEQQPFVACSYFLMCNKVYEAIDVLCGKGKVLDALALAKLRLPESDPMIFKLLNLLCQKCRRTSDSLGEVKCYLALNEPLMAIKSLGSMPDANCVKTAAYICRKYNMNDDAEKYKFIFMQRCLIQCDWESFSEFTNQEPDLQVYSTLFAVHEAFYKHLRDVKMQSGIFVKEIFSLPKSDEVKFWSGTTCIGSDESFIQFVCDVLASKNLLPTTENSLETMIKSLDNFSSKWDISVSSSDAHVAIAVYITKFILLAAAGDSAAATANFLKIFDSSCNIVFLPRVVFMLFFPINLLWSQDTKNIICQSKVHNLGSNTNKVITQYQHILQCVSEKIMNKSQPFDLTIVSKESLQNDLHTVIEKIAAALSLKDFSEFILTYFVSYIVHDLSRVMDKKVITLECYAKKVNSDLENNADENVVDKTVAEIPSECSLIYETEIQKEEESCELETLIDITLKEADEKIWTLTNLGASITLENASENSFQRENILDSCSNEMSSNEEKIFEKELFPNVDNEEPKNASKNKCYDEIYSSENMSSVGNCISQVHSDDDNSHNQCLASIDLFYHVILFLMSNICKEEFTLLYYLKERLASLHLAKASHELNKFSKANLNKSKLCSEINRGKVKDLTDETEFTLIKFNKIPNIVQNDDKNVIPNSAMAFTNENMLTAFVSNDHNYSSPQEIHESANKLDANSSQITDENLLKELPEFIHLLELKAKGISYPSPLDIVSKVLQILYNMRQKSTCIFIQEKLHMLIDDIVAWVGTFQVANINVVCTICH